jgi:hypothetical protein
MFASISKVKSLLFIGLLCLVIASCGDDDSSSSPNPTPKVTINLPENLSASDFSLQAAYYPNEKYTDLDLTTIKAYIGDFHPNNYIGSLERYSQNEIEYLKVNLDGKISTKGRFTAYKNINYNGIECEPENIARSTQPVRFFSVVNNKKQYELRLGVPVVSNPDLLSREYLIYYWSENGTATGKESQYNCNYDVRQGWNITEKAGNSLVNITNIQGEVKFTVKP